MKNKFRCLMVLSSRVASIQRSGIREIFDLAQNIPNVINLGIGEPNFKTPKYIDDAAKNAIDQGFDKYTVNIGIPELREQISRKLKRDNQIDADPKKEIIVTAGATQAIFLIMSCLLEQDDEVLLPTPIFTAYEYSARLSGAKPIQCPLNERGSFGFDLENLARHCTKRTRILVLNSPCNPTGVVYGEKDVRKILEFVAERDMYLISDEIYEKYLYEGAKCFSPACVNEFKNSVITVNGFSKTFAMTGWRLGYAAATEEIISAMTRFNMYNSVCPNSIAQKAGVAALKESLDFFEAVLKNYEKARKLMTAYLEEMSLSYVKPFGAFYIFPDISSVTKDSVSYCKTFLTEQHVATVPGSSFGNAGEAHIRLSYSADEVPMVIGLEKMKKFNDQFRK
jgi:aminotransferase